MKWIGKLLNIVKTNNTSSEYPEDTYKPFLKREKELEFFCSIKKYWETSDCSVELFPCRNPNLHELNEYARADVLSCFTKPRTNEKLSDFRLSQLGITNWYNFFNELLHDGYIRYANSEEILSSYFLKDLKIIADSLGIKKTGRKSELAQRICESVSKSELDDMLSGEVLFIIDEKGQEYLNANNDLTMFRAHAILDVSLFGIYGQSFYTRKKTRIL